MGKLGNRSGVRYTSSWCQLNEYHRLFMYMCVLRIIVEEHGYLFHRQVQDPLTPNSTAIEIFLPLSTRTEKKTAVKDE